MIKQVVFFVLLCLNFVAFHVVLGFFLKNFNRNINKSMKPVTPNRISIETLKIIGVSLVALIISSVLCAFDGISNEKYLGIAFVVPAILSVILALFYIIYFERIAKKNDAQPHLNVVVRMKIRAHAPASTLLGFFHAVIVGQLIYTLVALIA